MEETAATKKQPASGDICVRFWKGNIGVTLKPIAKRDGSYFWSYEPVRFAGAGRYYNNFTSKHDQALVEVLGEAIRYRDANDATEHVERVMAEVNQKQTA